MNIKPYSYKPKDTFIVKLLKGLTVAATIAAMGFFVYTVYDASMGGNLKERQQSVDELNKRMEELQRQREK